MNQNANNKNKSTYKMLSCDSLPTTLTSTITAAATFEDKRMLYTELPRNEKTTTKINEIPVLQTLGPNKFKQLRKKVSSKRPGTVISIELFDPIKTQVAKVSYTPLDKTTYRRSRSTSRDNKNSYATSETAQLSEMEPSTSINAQEDFAKKKQEREQEIKEIQEMLSEISKSPRSTHNSTSYVVMETKKTEVVPSNAKEEATKNSSNIHSLRRSNTDLQLNTNPKTPNEGSKKRLSRKDTSNSLTHGNLNSTQSKRRSKSSQLPLTAATNNTVSSRKTSYNPEDARRYMEVQKKKRKSNEADQAQTKSNIEKEEIKKRLEELKKNTRKLVNKNLEKKKLQNSDNFSNKTSKTKELPKQPENSLKDIKKNATNEINEIESNKLFMNLRASARVALTERPKPKINKEHSNRSTFSLDIPASLPLGENQKRIGLLRKTEDDIERSVSTFRSVTWGKENKEHAVLTPSKVSSAHDNSNSQKDFGNTSCTQKKDESKKETENSLKQNDSKKETDNSLEQKPEENLSDLDVPAKTLISSVKKEINFQGTKKITEHPTESQISTELPYLLRPSTAQIYPYNFIMAVRRKIEAVTQPAAIKEPRKRDRSAEDKFHEMERKSTKEKQGEHEIKKTKSENMESVKTNPIVSEGNAQISCSMENKNFSKIDFSKQYEYVKANEELLTLSLKASPSPRTYNIETIIDPPPKVEVSKSVKRTDYLKPSKNNFIDVAEDFDEVNKATIGAKKHQSMESITSDFSSVSLQLPISNTLTEVSSLKTDSRRTYTHSVGKQNQFSTEDEVNSMSSLAFSSPEKKYNKQQRNGFEFAKPRPVSPLSLEKVDKLKIKSKINQDYFTNQHAAGTEDTRNVHFTQLLEDFNRSLSQVIQVNEQLKTTLDKSNRILSPRASKSKTPSSETDKQYSSDFENSPHHSEQSEKLKQNLKNTNQNLIQRKHIFEISSKVSNPLLTLQNISSDSGQSLNLSLNLKSVSNSNSSARTTTSIQTNDIERVQSDGNNSYEQNAEQSQEEFEKRLQVIETLKENLKQSIKESQEKHKSSKTSKDTISSRVETNSLKSNISNMSIHTLDLDTENRIERLKATQSKTDYTDKKFNYNEKELISEKFTDTLKEPNQNETLVLYKRSDKTASSESEETLKKVKEHYLIRKQNNKPEKPKQNRDFEILSSQSSGHDICKQARNLNGFSTEPTCSERSQQKSVHSRSGSQNSKLMIDEIVEGLTQSEVDSDNRNSSKRNSAKIIVENVVASSSISEKLQNTYTTASLANESVPAPAVHSQRNKNNPNQQSSKANNSSFIKTHINRSRGDFHNSISNEALHNEREFQLAVQNSSQASSTEFHQSADDEVTSSVKSNSNKHRQLSASKPSTYEPVSKRSKTHSNMTTATASKSSRRISIGSEIVNFFNKYDNENCQLIHDNISESSLNYSNVGLYDKLIQNETTKSEHLTALLKMREKALLDRTKGQLALLEVQKARYKAKGLISNIAAVKKKQRGILLKMEKERDEIKRLLQSNSINGQATAQSYTSPILAQKPAFPLNNKSGSSGSSNHNLSHTTPTKHKRDKLPTPAVHTALVPIAKRPLKSLRQNHSSSVRSEEQQQSLQSVTILRATYELESSQALEKLLKKREEDLRKRRQHVEHLMKWHQRLDEEEAEVLQLERQLLKYNNVPQQFVADEDEEPQHQHKQQQQQQQMLLLQSDSAKKKLTPLADKDQDTTLIQSAAKSPEKRRASRARKMEKRLKDIDKSLKELSHISASSAANSAVVMGQNSDDVDASFTSATHDVEFVRTTGLKLNKLWRRLTSQTIEKYEPNRKYKLCKSDLEHLYEEAKMAVLRDFAQDEERIAKELLEKSSTNLSTSPPQQRELDASGSCSDPDVDSDGKASVLEIPILNLNFSSGHSEADDEAENNAKRGATTPQGIYSPSAAEHNFKAQLLNSSASSSSDNNTEPEQVPATSEHYCQQQRIENNVQMFLALTQRLRVGTTGLDNKKHQTGLHRSLSDTQIADIPKLSSAATTSHINTSAVNASQSNTGIMSSGECQSTTSQHHQSLLIQHQRSKSSIVEITHIPNEVELVEAPLVQDICKSNKEEPKTKDCTLAERKEKTINVSRLSVIKSVGNISPVAAPALLPLQRDEEVRKQAGTCPSYPSEPRKTFSAQVGLNSEQRANEISSKLDEISAAVMQLSLVNALPSYTTATTQTYSKTVALTDPPSDDQPCTNDENNLSSDVSSSYSFNFANISTDRHSSPGTHGTHANNSQLRSNTSPNTTATTTLTKETKNSTESITNSNTVTFTIAPNTTKTKTFVKDIPNTSSSLKAFVKDQMISSPSQSSISSNELKSPGVSELRLEKTISDEYEPDFEPDSSDETNIENISLPLYETTAETTTDGLGEENSLNQNSPDDADADKTPAADKTFCTIVKNIDNIQDESSSALHRPTTATTSSCTVKEQLPPPPPMPPPPPPPPILPTASTSTTTTSVSSSSLPPVQIVAQTSNGQLMPDIINELELRRHQLILDNEHLKQYEHVAAVPYMYVREIPNKPPPPYVPPAHGSPMTTIFPSEDRIKDITFRRTHELYCELLKTEYCNDKGKKLPSVMEEQITNIYERIILDICREYLEEHNEILRDGDPSNFHSQLAFFNPPNRLRCIQDAIYKEVRSCLAMDKAQPKRTQQYSVYGQRAKQDHIGKIIIQEMYDEDDRWCNFHREESEVLHLIVEEMIQKNIRDLAKDVLLEEGGSIEEEEELIEGVEIEELECTEIQDNLQNEEDQNQSELGKTVVITNAGQMDNETTHNEESSSSLTKCGLMDLNENHQTLPNALLSVPSTSPA